jgi:SAM-dependent methyltransferase
MRDPRGRIFAAHDRMVRELATPLPKEDFLHQAIAHDMVRGGLLIDYSLLDATHVVAPRLAFVSQPSEWCRLQLLDAALLTLDVAEKALAAGFELKDASAWNVIFDGCIPIFCDHLSFEAVVRRQWRALGQFARHFILPLLVTQKCGLQVHAQFRIFRDGITPQDARRLCGWRLWFSRAMPLALAAYGGESQASADSRAASIGAQPGLHSNLFRYCRTALPSRARMEAGRQSARTGRVQWSSYERERDHYSASALEFKSQQVHKWLERAKPSWVLDLGANAGEFTLLAARGGARVIAVDADHDCIERLYLRARSEPLLARAVYPVIAQLDDLCAGRGWCGRESPGLLARLDGRCDLVMMLGLLHHLMIACAIPVGEIAAFAAALTRDALIIEVISEQDPMFRKLAAQYGRTDDAPTTCGEAAQREAFARHFEIVDQGFHSDSHRTLLMLKKKIA